MRIGYQVNKKLDLSMEYYGATDPLKDQFRLREQGRCFFPAAISIFPRTSCGIVRAQIAAVLAHQYQAT